MPDEIRRKFFDRKVETVIEPVVTDLSGDIKNLLETKIDKNDLRIPIFDGTLKLFFIGG